MIRLRWAIVLASLALSLPARAASNDAATAEALFDQGRTLMKDGRYAEACPKFEASQKLDPGVGTLLNLGDCFEHLGLTASAWARFREAASLAANSSQKEREQAARERAQALEPKLIRLVVRPDAAAAADGGVHIVRDGVPLERDIWGTPFPIDPGKHVITATAPGKTSWSMTFEVDPVSIGKTREIQVPALASEPAPSTSNMQRTIGLIVGGVGAVALGVGAGFALDAKSTYDDAKSRCRSDACDSDSRDQASSAGNTADIATGFFIGGAVVLGVGVVLFLTAPRHAPAGPSIGRARLGFTF